MSKSILSLRAALNTIAIVSLFALACLGCDGTVVDNSETSTASPTDATAGDSNNDNIPPTCNLPTDELAADITPSVCAGTNCIGFVFIDPTTPPYTSGDWAVPGASPPVYNGTSGDVLYPFSANPTTYRWSVRACNDVDKVCCKNTAGSVTFNR